MNSPTDWLSALAIVAAGLVLGFIVFLASRRRTTAKEQRRLELAGKRDALVQQLRELGDDVADSERAWLENETAAVLRELDRLPAIAPANDTKPRSSHPRAVGFGWGVISTLVVVAIVYYGSSYTKEREPVTNPPTRSAAAAPADIKDLETAVRNDPDNTENRIALAKAYFSRDDLMATFEQTKAVLEKNPYEPRALTYNAVVKMAMGELEEARAMLELATQRDPKLLDAWVALASAYSQSGNPDAAAAAIDSAIAQHPEDETRLRDVLAQLRKQASTPPGEMPVDHPPLEKKTKPVATPPAAAPASGPASAPIHVTLSLDPSSPVKKGVVYVIARGAEAGHPLAVRRVEATSFPMSVDLGSSDVMMGQPFPATVRVEARLDTDGDAGTNDPADPKAFANGVPAGGSIELKLARMQ